MLKKLKDMFTIAPTVEFVSFEDGLLAVRSKKALKTNNMVIKVRTHLGTVVANVLLESYDKESKVYRLTLYDKEVILNAPEAERRDAPRLNKVLRVTSQSFPGYSANTEDISASGIRVRTSGPLDANTVIDFQMELDDPQIPAFQVRSEVCWTAVRADGSYHSGLRFQHLDPNIERVITRYIKDRINQEKRLHTLEEVEPPI
jgi:hypothetical protein